MEYNIDRHLPSVIILENKEYNTGVVDSKVKNNIDIVIT